MAKARVTARDVEDAEDCLAVTLEECRALVAKHREGNVDRARVKLAKEAVESAERDLSFIRRKYGEQNVEEAAEALGATVEWGKLGGSR